MRINLGMKDYCVHIKRNDPRVKSIISGMTEYDAWDYESNIRNMTDEEWEELGRDIAMNTHFEKVELFEGALNDHRMSCFFLGLTRSSSIERITLFDNQLSTAGVQSMVPFLQNANNLTYLDLDFNNIQSEGFNVLFRALRDSPIEKLSCENCRIESIEIIRENMPKHLEYLNLEGNSIKTDGCSEIAKLLQRGDATLERLYLQENDIDDEGVEILVDALKSNTSLRELCLMGNVMSKRGLIMLLKLVNDMSSIKATYQSNHTLDLIHVIDPKEPFNALDKIQQLINVATGVNTQSQNDPYKAGWVKVITYQLCSVLRGHSCRLRMSTIACSVRLTLYSYLRFLHW